ncbi:DUF3077 domain-containing protein [Pseudomonas gessardii]|uniref:DUF3077 domain-containing protein n=1 Tax=Pseudomonas gessardii TaxID=78544 RepID=A0ABS9FB13_9PSED|nr:DUF3077 domain-containing protein [Pseudomonas gessardii]MCF4979142.1 DUF3077 domain-containing protein [Pseudomonas gessardii]MCF4989542.1 DUF3077 domain-containing protein [Pseudomonas gessardii]MCF5086787.1 DUF3077 domain-containing protein [Pseudomonas gessardii]MCF5098420.1 DUF3077 domain-containing protein [Pseudomonas gessardii]MCF5109545.1 DUF3077 domain-containing protein [Pseudomonas gessardii]
MTQQSVVKTVGVTTFAHSLEQDRDVFRVNAGMPVQDALDHVSALLHCAHKLAVEAAMDTRGEHYAWASHSLCEMGKAIVDDLKQAMVPAKPEPRAS